MTLIIEEVEFYEIVKDKNPKKVIDGEDSEIKIWYIVLNPNVRRFKILFSIAESNKLYKKEVDYDDEDALGKQNGFLPEGDGPFVYGMGKSIFADKNLCKDWII